MFKVLIYREVQIREKKDEKKMKKLSEKFGRLVLSSVSLRPLTEGYRQRFVGKRGEGIGKKERSLTRQEERIRKRKVLNK